MEHTPKVNRPMQVLPCYALPAGASTDEIRAAAVRAMRDALTVNWTAPGAYILDKYMTDLSSRFLRFTPDRVYSGMAYTNGNTGILTWLQFYDPETGMMRTDMPTLVYELGNACFIGAMWGWSAVLPDWWLWNAPDTFLQEDIVAVGPYRLEREKWVFLHDYSTTAICALNGEQTLYESYACVKPADLLSYRRPEDDHTVMAVENAVVVRNPDGSVDGDRSSVLCQEQAFRYAPAESDGQTVYRFGNTSHRISFRSLWYARFIPYTHRIFTGEKPYVPAAVTIEGVKDGCVGSFEDLKTCTLHSTFKIITAEVSVTDTDGAVLTGHKQVLMRKHHENTLSLRYPGRALPDTDFLDCSMLKDGKTYTYTLSLLVADGERFTPVTFPFVYRKTES